MGTTESNRDMLLEVANILNDYEDQDDQRIQEENTVVYWLMKAVNNGLAETIDEYSEAIANLYS